MMMMILESAPLGFKSIVFMDRRRRR